MPGKRLTVLDNLYDTAGIAIPTRGFSTLRRRYGILAMTAYVLLMLKFGSGEDRLCEDGISATVSRYQTKPEGCWTNVWQDAELGKGNSIQ